jgi:hypothetical protein
VKSSPLFCSNILDTLGNTLQVCIEQLLGMHRQSLKFIEIGIIPGTPAGMLDFSSFQCLEELHISIYDLLSETPSNAQAKLAAPCLRHLPVSFRTEYLHQESHNAFAGEQVRWMQDFANLKTRHHPDSQLKTLFINFNPRNLASWDDSGHGLTWRWDYLDEAVQILAQHGVALTYSEPGRSRQVWEAAVEEAKAAGAR